MSSPCSRRASFRDTPIHAHLHSVIAARTLACLQKGLKPGSKAARALTNVNHGTSMAAAHGAGQAAPEPPKPPSPPDATKPLARRKEYIPRKGTANYTFLVCMFRGLKLGKLHYGKEELMQLAEASGLADKPIHGGNAAASVHAGNVHEAYNGWSCFTVRRAPCACSCLPHSDAWLVAPRHTRAAGSKGANLSQHTNQTCWPV